MGGRGRPPLGCSQGCCDHALCPPRSHPPAHPQVTNPPIDPVREAVVTSLRTFVGPQADISARPGPETAARLELEHPILSLEVRGPAPASCLLLLELSCGGDGC